jgi:hypothetical protein
MAPKQTKLIFLIWASLGHKKLYFHHAKYNLDKNSDQHKFPKLNPKPPRLYDAATTCKILISMVPEIEAKL